MNIIATPSGDVELRESIENPQFGLTGERLVEVLGLNTQTHTGKTINPDKAISGTVAVYACVALRANTVGSLPLKLWERLDERRRERVPLALAGVQRLARLIYELPNPEMSAQSFWSSVVGHRDLWGNAYVNVVRGGDGWPVELWPLHPGRVQVFRNLTDRNQPRFYVVTLPDGSRRRLESDEVMHIPAFSTDGLQGLSPITVARNAIGIEQAASEYAGRFFAASATPSSILTIPRVPGQGEERDAAFAAKIATYRDAIKGMYGGLDRAQRVAILEAGIEWKAAGMSNEDAQFLQTRKFQLNEICRLFGIPPHMVGDTEPSTSWGTGIEEQKIGFLTFTLLPILTAITSAISRDLGLVPGVRTLRDDGYYSEFETKALLVGDVKTRYEAYEIAIRNRILSPEDVAALEDIPFNPDRPKVYENPNTLGKKPGESRGQQLELFDQRIALLERSADRQPVPSRIVNNIDLSSLEDRMDAHTAAVKELIASRA